MTEENKGWPSWAVEMSPQELADVVDQYDHNIKPEVGVRGFVCAVMGCEAQCQRWGNGWWHVPELIAYARLAGDHLLEDKSQDERVAEVIGLWDEWAHV